MLLARTIIVFIILTGTIRCDDILRWKWSTGTDEDNPPSSDVSLGPRTGAAVTYTHAGTAFFYVFGGLKYDSNVKKTVLKNDLWESAHILIHPGSINNENSSSVPQPRQFSSLCGIYKSMVVLFGGLSDKNQVLGDTWIYFFAEKKWMNLQDALKFNKKNSSIADQPAPRYLTAAWCGKDKMIIFSGLGENNENLEDMWEFSLLHLSWSQTRVSTKYTTSIEAAKQVISYPAPRHGAAIALNRKRQLYLFGGNTNLGLMSDLWNYDLNKGQWRLLAGKTIPGNQGMAPYFRKHSYDNFPGCRHGAALMVDHYENIWLFGGEGVGTTTAPNSKWPTELLADLWNYDVKMKQWAFFGGHKEGNPPGNYVMKGEYNGDARPRPRFYFIVFQGINNMIIMGGSSRNSQNKDLVLLGDVWSIDLHKYVEYANAASLGTVMLLLFLGLGLFSVSTFMFIKVREFYNTETLGFYVKKQVTYDSNYTQLAEDSDL